MNSKLVLPGAPAETWIREPAPELGAEMNTTAIISQTEAGQGYAVPIQILRGDEDKGGLLGVILGPLFVDKAPGSWLKHGGHAFISWVDDEPRRKIAVGATVHDAIVTTSFVHDAMVTVSFTSAE